MGQGLGNSVGMALAERLLAARFGKELVDHYTYVIAGDGCLMEGISQEAISLAGHLRLSKLIVLWDDNGISIDGGTALSTSDDQLARFSAAGWDADAVDGHDTEALAAAISEARTSVRPSLIACRTTIAFGAPTKAGTAAAHGSPAGRGRDRRRAPAPGLARAALRPARGRGAVLARSRSARRQAVVHAWNEAARRGRDPKLRAEFTPPDEGRTRARGAQCALAR